MISKRLLLQVVMIQIHIAHLMKFIINFIFVASMIDPNLRYYDSKKARHVTGPFLLISMGGKPLIHFTDHFFFLPEHIPRQ